MAENVQTPETQQFEYKAEMKQLLNLIINSLYTHPEIFLRELISNASDALNKARFRSLTDKDMLGGDAALQITINVDSEKKTFTIEDSGIGMKHDELVERLGTVASSGTLEFLNTLQDKGEQKVGDMIGQFGVGFYSVFMVADEVSVETRHGDADSKGYRWQSDGKGTFSIEEIEREERGTKISFTLKEGSAEFADEYRIKSIIKKYSNFVEFPIFLGEEKVNTVRALWHEPKDQIKDEEYSEFYKFVSNDFSDPLGRLHFSIEGSVNFKALLFVPGSSMHRSYGWHNEKTVHLYSNKVFIQDDCKDLLPEYLHFVKGVVDTEDLPLNVSREVTQNSPVMTKINQVISGRVLGLLEEWADNDKENFDRFYKAFGAPFALGVNTDYGNRDKIINLLRFQSSRLAPGELTGLKAYVERMPEDQSEIYYLAGEHRETMTNNPNLEYFRKNDIEVLLLTDPVDIMVMPGIDKFDEKPLKSIEKADIDVSGKQQDDDKEQLNEELSESLLKVFKETLGEVVEDVRASKRLVDSPVTLVVGKEGMDVHVERMMKMMDQNYSGAKKILEVNLGHPLIKNLSRIHLANQDSDTLKPYVQQLYDSALLLEGNLNSPSDFVARMASIMEEATKG